MARSDGADLRRRLGDTCRPLSPERVRTRFHPGLRDGISADVPHLFLGESGLHVFHADPQRLRHGRDDGGYRSGFLDFERHPGKQQMEHFPESVPDSFGYERSDLGECNAEQPALHGGGHGADAPVRSTQSAEAGEVHVS